MQLECQVGDGDRTAESSTALSFSISKMSPSTASQCPGWRLNAMRETSCAHSVGERAHPQLLPCVKQW